jgi:hypothetical protein
MIAEWSRLCVVDLLSEVQIRTLSRSLLPLAGENNLEKKVKVNKLRLASNNKQVV